MHTITKKVVLKFCRIVKFMKIYEVNGIIYGY